jgi:DNA-directed RNA polymerase specialized sigma24 family protein
METTSTIDDQSLLDFVAGTLPAAETFPSTARPLMLRFAWRTARELPRDLHDEVVSQSLEYLIEYGSRFQPERGTAKAFLKVVTGQAARKVRADYCPPGCRTRLEPRNQRHARPEVLTISELEGENPEHPDALKDLDTTCVVREILLRAPTKIAQALVLIYFLGETVSTAAKAVGMSRFALNREITRFMRTEREAAAA